jgi:hypothetical protein
MRTIAWICGSGPMKNLIARSIAVTGDGRDENDENADD